MTMQWWPSPLDYQDALQNPRAVFTDVELRDGTVVSDALGLPKPISGSFATVYQVDYQTRRHAVRCFLRQVPDIAERYAAISAYLQQAALASTVEFSFLPRGIRLRGQWFPVLKMDWVEGKRLDVFIAQHLNDASALIEITRQFLQLADSLRRANIAHGDLQHGNLLVVRDKLVLLDYDGMFVPTLAGRLSNELGQPNYQHPLRSARDYAPYLDNFSVWVITLSLLGLALDPDLRFGFAGGGGEAILLQHTDFINPAQSKMLRALQRSPNPTLSLLTNSFLKFLAQSDLRAFPPLEAANLSSLQAAVPVAANLPEWLLERVGAAPLSPALSSVLPTANPALSNVPPAGGVEWLFDHLEAPPPPPQELRGHFWLEKFLLILIVGLLGFIGAIMLFGQLDLVLGLGALGFIALLTIAAFGFGFGLRYNSAERREAMRAVRQWDLARQESDAEIQELDAQRAQLESKQQAAQSKLQRAQHETASAEQAALAALERTLKSELAKLDARRRALQAEEQDTLAKQLEIFQARKFQELLEAFRVADANLPFIVSGEMKKRLVAHGFVTAADVVDWQVNVLHSAKRFGLMNRHGKVVYIEGLTPKHGVALVLWRRTLEARVRRLVPDTLPPELSAVVRKKFQDKQVTLSLSELKARQGNEAAKKRVQQDAQLERARHERAYQDAVAQNRLALNEIEQALARARKELAEQKFELVMARRQLAPFAHVNFSNYLRAIFTL